jgi:hypothetical protein
LTVPKRHADGFFQSPGRALGWPSRTALQANLPNFNQQQPRLRFADMNGDGMVDMVMLQSRQITYWPGWVMAVGARRE